MKLRTTRAPEKFSWARLEGTPSCAWTAMDWSCIFAPVQAITNLTPTSDSMNLAASNGFCMNMITMEAMNRSPVETIAITPIPSIVRTPSMSLMAREVISPVAFVSNHRADNVSRWA